MGSIFIKRGLAADYGAAYWLPRLVGISKAHELFYSGDLLNAEACVEWGIANRVVQADQLVDEALAYGRMIANGPPMGYTGVRRMLQRSTDMSMTHFLEYEWATQLTLLASDDGKEGFRAFAQSVATRSSRAADGGRRGPPGRRHHRRRSRLGFATAERLLEAGYAVCGARHPRAADGRARRA